MSVIVESGEIRLCGRCLADDAETLLAALLNHPGTPVSIENVQKLHLAVVQVLLAAGAEVQGSPANPFLARHVVGLIR